MQDFNPQLIGNFAILDSDERDFYAGAAGENGVEIFIPTLENPIYPEYHQYKFAEQFTKGMCTMAGPMGAISTLASIHFSDEQQRAMYQLRYDQADFDRVNGGGYTSVGVNCGRKYFNDNNKRKIKSIALQKTDPLVTEAILKGHRIVWGYKGNAAYQADYQQDGSIDNAEWGKPTYGHILTQAVTRDGRFAIDNYAGRKSKDGIYTNFYKLAVWDQMVLNPNVHHTVYFYLYEDQLTQSQLDRFEAKKRLIWDATRENYAATRYEAATMVTRANKIIGKAVEIPIWNGLDPKEPAIKQDVLSMIDRGIGPITRNLGKLLEPATRGEVAELIIRTMRNINAI